MNFKFTFGIILSFIVIFLVPGTIFAANYSVTPLIIDKELEKRDIITETITIVNKDSRTIRIYPSINEISTKEDGDIKTFQEPSISDNSVSITSWVQIPRKRIEIKAGETREITVNIRVNPEVKPGEYHAFIGFGEGSNRPEAEKKVRNGDAPGTILRISVDKVQNQFLRLEKFNIERFVLKDSDENSIVYSINNPGKSPVVPRGEIIFYDNNGTEIYSMPVNTEKLEITSDKSQEFSMQIPQELTRGKYKAFLSVEYGEFLTASLNDTAFFYVVPLKQLIIIFVVFLFLAILIAVYVHRRYDMGITEHSNDGTEEIPMYIRSEKSDSQDHDIDLSKKDFK